MSESKGLIVRPAVAYDAVNIVRLLTKAWQEMDASEVNTGKAMAYVTAMLANSYVAVADLSGRIVGTIACGHFKPPWSDVEMVRQEWFYVLRSFREGTASADLLGAMETYLDRQNLAGVLNPPVELEGVLKVMLERPGYRPITRAFLRLPDPTESELA